MHRKAPATGYSVHSGQTPAAAEQARLATRLLASCAALWLAAATPTLVHAEDYVIDDHRTAQNGGYWVNDNDTITVTPDGSITVTEYGDDGLAIIGNDSVAVNRGSLSTFGGNGRGINVQGDNNKAFNHGSIVAREIWSGGMRVYGDGNLIANTGSIHVGGSFAGGMEMTGTDNYAFNSGLIVVTSDNSRGGMWVHSTSRRNTVHNAGTILAKGDRSVHGIMIDGNNHTIINSGTIMSDYGFAIRVSGRRNKINLLSGTFLKGRIHLGNGSYLNVKHVGPYHSTRWVYRSTLTELTVTGPLQHYHDADQKIVAFYDHTALAGTLDQLGDTQSLLSALGAYGARQKGRHIWATGTAAAFTHDGDETTFERDIELSAFAAGYNHDISDTLTVGVMMAHIWGEHDGNSWLRPTYAIESKAFFGGARASIDLGPVDVDLGLTLGRVYYDHERFINDAQAVLGESWASSEYDGMYYSVDATLGGRIPVATVTLKPTLGVIYTVHNIDGHTESGATDNATIGDRELSLLTVKAGMAVEKKLFDVVTAHIKGGYLARANQGDQSAQVTLMGQTKSFDYGETDKAGIYIGGGITIDLGGNANLSASVVSYNGDGYDGLQAVANFSVGF